MRGYLVKIRNILCHSHRYTNPGMRWKGACAFFRTEQTQPCESPFIPVLSVKRHNAAVSLLSVLHTYSLWFRAFIAQIKFSCSQYFPSPGLLPGCQLVFCRPVLTPLKKARNNVGLSLQHGNKEIKMSPGAFKAVSTIGRLSQLPSCLCILRQCDSRAMRHPASITTIYPTPCARLTAASAQPLLVKGQFACEQSVNTHSLIWADTDLNVRNIVLSLHYSKSYSDYAKTAIQRFVKSSPSCLCTVIVHHSDQWTRFTEAN